MTGNVTGRTFSRRGTLSGGRSVIDQEHLQGRLTNGALISNPPAVGGIIFEGDIAEYNYGTKLAKHLKVFKLAAEITDASTEIQFVRNDFTHQLEAGLVLMVAPSALNGTGRYITVGAVTKKNVSLIGNVYSCAITAGVFGSGVTIPANTLFVEGVPAGSIEAYSVANGGADYVAGDIITVTQTGGANGTFEVLTVDVAGAIETVRQTNKGTGYAVANGLATTTNSVAGAGATISITAIGAGMLVTNPNAIFTTDVYIDVVPATGDSDYDGARYHAPLYNVCTLLGAKVTPIPAAVKANLRTGYSDIKIFE
jgi:hypothetical protein